MRGQDEQQLDVFSYVSPEQRVPQDHPLRPLRVMTDEALRELQPRFNKLYAKTGRPSNRAVAEGSASWGLQGWMSLHLCGSRLQPRSHAESGASSGLSQGCNVSDGSKKDVLATSGSGPSVLRVTKSRNQ